MRYKYETHAHTKEASACASASGEQDIFLGGVESKESLLNRFLEIKKSIAGILSKLGKREQSASSLVASVLNKIS